MKPVAKTSRGPPKPVCVIRDEPHYTVADAARVIERVSESTLRRWVVNGWTSFDLSLDIVRRKRRLLIPELKVLVLKEFFDETPLPPRTAPAVVREEFRQAVRLAGFHFIRPRTAYSRARNPRPGQR